MKELSLADILTSPSLSVPPEYLVRDALSLMRDRRLGVLAVTQEQRPVGIFTERDAVRLDNGDKDIDTVRIGEVMDKSVPIVTLQTSRREGQRILLENDSRYLVVVEETGIFVATLGERDFVELLREDSDGLEKSKETDSYPHMEASRAYAILSALVKASSDVIFVKDRDGRYIIANQALADLLGRTVEEIIGADDLELFPDEMARQFQFDDTHIMESGRISTYEEMVMSEERTIPFLTTKGPLMIDGEIEGIFAIARDISSIKSTEKSLRESEQRFHAIFEQAAVGVAQIDTETGRFLKVNQTYCDIVGRTAEAMKQVDFMTLTHPDDLQEDMRNMDRLKAGEIKQFSMKKRYYSTQESIVWVNLSVSPLFWKDGVLQSHIAIVEDITQSHQAGEELKERERQLSTLFSNLPGMVYRCQNLPDWPLDFVSSGAFTLTGHEVDAFVSQSVNYNELIHKDDQQRVWDEVQQAILENRAYEVEYRIITKEGQERWVWEEGRSLLDDEGDIIALEGYITDITEAKQTKEKEQVLLDLLNASSNEFYVFDKSTLLFTTLNSGSLNNLQYTFEELRHLHPYDIKPEFSESSFKEAIRPLIDRSKTQLIFETEHQRKDGTRYPVEVHLQLLRTAGEHEEFLAVIIDITKRKIIEAKLKEQEELMIVQSRQAAMGEMINMIAHQWRQPLSVVSMASNSLQADIELEQLDTDDVVVGLKSIDEQVQYMSRTIDDFRNFFQRSKTFEEVNVSTLLEEVMMIIAPAMHSNSIEVRIDCDPKIKVKTYKSEFTQVIINILMNAKDALMRKRSDKTIEIILRDLDEDVRLSISNNGPNIPEHQLASIFEPYFTTKERSGGTGLGLYMARSIVEKHMKGTITASNFKEGVEFTIDVPSKLDKDKEA